MIKATLLLVVFAVAAQCSSPAIDLGIIQKVNSASSTWKAGVNSYFLGQSMDQVKHLMGWKKNGVQLEVRKPEVVGALPQQFNSATNWANCSTIGTIYNQARCGSCWAFGCVEAVSDRFCIASNGAVNEILSFEDETSCGPCDGCEGGDAGAAWEYVQNSGLVTGKCYPYQVPTCPPQQQPCLDFVDTPPCQQSCSDGETWSQSKHYLSNAYSVSSDPSAIQQEILSNGPVEACFSVYADFVHYKSGVYQHVSGDYLGGHCVKIIGWGVENGTPYWLVNNSWTTYWGDKGQFKILRGSDECGIEDDIVAGTPQLS